MNIPAPSAEQIFTQAVTFVDASERCSYLDRACAGNDEMRSEVESLLRAHEQAGDFLKQAIPLPVTDFAIERTGTMIGRYKLLQKIGEGGFPAVVRANLPKPPRTI